MRVPIHLRLCTHIRMHNPAILTHARGADLHTNTHMQCSHMHMPVHTCAYPHVGTHEHTHTHTCTWAHKHGHTCSHTCT